MHGNGSLSSATWILVLPTGMALLARHRFPSDLRVLGLLMLGYGTGNLASNLIVGSLKLKRPERLVSVGRLVCGLGFIGMAFAPKLPLMMGCAALAATGGPITDIGFISLVQAAFDPHQAARIYRLGSALAWGSTLVLFLVSPVLFEAMGVPAVIGAAGLGLALTGASGFVLAPPHVKGSLRPAPAPDGS